MTLRSSFFLLFSFAIVLSGIDSNAMTANKKISLNKPVYGSQQYGMSCIVDGKFGNSTWIVSSGSWAAINVGSRYSKVYVSFNCTNYMWADTLAYTSCPQNIGVPRNYLILTSAYSTNGSDGDWKAADTIKDNIVAARGHIIDFTGANWVKMAVDSGTGYIDEIEIYDASNGFEDSWFFAGTSITANAFKGPVKPETFSDIVNSKYSSFTPAIIRGGIGCILSTAFANSISGYIACEGNMAYWAIEMGTNDAWGGDTSNLSVFKTNLQKVIDSCKAHGIKPIIARIIATDSAVVKWQVNPRYLDVIDTLTSKNNLIPGPDFYTWFKNHTDAYNSDGVHPDSIGGLAIQELWTEKMDSLYKGKNSSVKAKNNCVDEGFFKTEVSKDGIMISVLHSGTACVFSTDGRLIKNLTMESGSSLKLRVPSGIYFVKFKTVHGTIIKSMAAGQ